MQGFLPIPAATVRETKGGGQHFPQISSHYMSCALSSMKPFTVKLWSAISKLLPCTADTNARPDKLPAA